MRIDVLTIFPEMFASPLQESIVQRAQAKGLVEILVHDFRQFSLDKHQKVDDYPYGGGPGMVLKPEPIAAALEAVRAVSGPARTVLLSPQGKSYCQETAKELAAENHMVLVCGHYKGLDERIRMRYIDDEISIGDYVLSGGELPAMVVIDAVVRLIPGVIGDLESAEGDSYFGGLLDHPHYTRPEVFEGIPVPEVLVSGHHEQIRLWRRREALRRTVERRPDLLKKASLSEEDVRLLQEIQAQPGKSEKSLESERS